MDAIWPFLQLSSWQEGGWAVQIFAYLGIFRGNDLSFDKIKNCIKVCDARDCNYLSLASEKVVILTARSKPGIIHVSEWS